MPTSAGCKALKDSIAPDDSYAVKKLKEEGAIILAKANMSEICIKWFKFPFNIRRSCS